MWGSLLCAKMILASSHDSSLCRKLFNWVSEAQERSMLVLGNAISDSGPDVRRNEEIVVECVERDDADQNERLKSRKRTHIPI